MSTETKENIIITDFEMETVNSLRSRAQQIFLQLGQITLERKIRLNELDEMEASLMEQYSSISEEESKFFDTLRDKYGDGVLNPMTGEFTPN